jgi:hypothetical protein
MFKLKRPCVDCPFRIGMGEKFQLSQERLTEIFRAVAFQCHKTVNYFETYDGEETYDHGDHPQQCAGLMAILHRNGTPNQIMQMGMRFNYLWPHELDPDGEAYATVLDARAAHMSGK